MQRIRAIILLDGHTRSRQCNAYLVLTALLVVSLICFGSLASVAKAAAEHPYIIFQDDFEDEVAEDWRIYPAGDAPSGSGWTIEQDDGNHVLSGTGHAHCDAGEESWTDYIFEFKLKLLPFGGGHICFRQSEGRYFLAFGDGNYFTLWKTSLIGTTYALVETEVGLDLKVWYTVKTVCIGNSLEIYVDDVLIISYVDEENPPLYGTIGFESIHGLIYIDDFQVSITHHLYVTNLIEEAKYEINKAKMIDADTVRAEKKLAEAQEALDNGNLSGAEVFTREAIDLAQFALVGYVSVNDLLQYPAEYNMHTVEISGTIKGIQYEQGVYRFAIDDGTAAISATFDGTLGEITNEDRIKVEGMFDASIKTVIAENLEKIKSFTEGLYTFLVFKDDFEDEEVEDWLMNIDSDAPLGSSWAVELDDGNRALFEQGHVWAEAGDVTWTDYIFEVKIKVLSPGPGGGHINFRMLGAGRYFLVFNSNDHFTLSKEDPTGAFNNLVEMEVGLDLNVWYTVKILCVGNSIEVYIDDLLKINYVDTEDPILSGRIGLESTSGSIYCDDVKVSKIASTSDISDLITYAQSEIDEAKEINADTNAAELKLEQAKQALDQEDYQMVQYLVDDAVWLAKRANIGQISITNLKTMSSKCIGHVIKITGTVKNLTANLAAGYSFFLDDGTGSIPVTYQGTLMDIGNDYEISVTGIFDASKGTVAASNIERLIGPPPGDITWSIELIAVIISLVGFAVGGVGWIVRTRGARKRKKILFTKLMEDVDDVYLRFKMNAVRCQTELYRLREQVLDEFKQGLIDEEKYNILNKRVDDYLKEVEEKIAREKTR